MAIERVSLNNARRVSPTISKQEFLEGLGVDRTTAAKLAAMGGTRADCEKGICVVRWNKKTDILEALGVSREVAAKLVALDSQAETCGGHNGCFINYPATSNEITVSDVQKMIDKGVIKTTDIKATMLQKIRK